MEPRHLRLDFSLGTSRAEAVHDEPDEGVWHRTTLLATDVRLFAEYGLLPSLAVQAMLPLRIIGTRTRYTDLITNAPVADFTSIHHRNETLAGLGDAQLLLHRGFKAGHVLMSARAGVSLPLGVVHENPFKLGDEGLPHEHIQLGTGTFDPVLAADASAPLGAFSLSAYASLQAPLYQGSTGYRAGARTLGGVVLSRPVESLTLRLAAEAYHEQPERWDGVVPTDDGNQGRIDLYVTPGVTWNFSGEWMLTADVHVRAFSHVVGAQLDMPVVLDFGIGRLFHLEQTSDDEPAADVTRAQARFVVTDFWASWCEPCKVLSKRLGELAAQRSWITLKRIEVEEPEWSLPRARLEDAQGRVLWEASGRADDLYDELERRTRF